MHEINTEASPNSDSTALDSSPASSVVSGTIPTLHDDVVKSKSIIRAIWSEILGEDVEDIGDEASFFELGGDSLSAAELIKTAKQNDVVLTIEDIFADSTLDGMAAKSRITFTNSKDDLKKNLGSVPFLLVQNRLSERDSVEELRSRLAVQCAVQTDQIEDIYPCSPLQEAMMTASQRGLDSYMTQLAYELNRNLDVTQFRSAWERLISSNAPIRTRIVRDKTCGMLQCVINGTIDWAEVDSLDTYLTEDSNHSMREGDSLMRLALVRAAEENRPKLVITFHHAVFDAVSFTHILSDLADLYDGFAPKARLPFSSYIQHLQELDVNAADTYWADEVKGSNPTPFPSLPDKQFEPMASSEFIQSVEFEWTVPSGLTKSLLLRAAWALLLSLRSHNKDVSFGLTLSGRNAFGGTVEEVAGPTITAVPIRLNLDFESSIGHFLEQIRQQAVAMIPFEQYGILNVRRRLGDDGVRACDFQSLLLVQSITDSDLRDTLARAGMVPASNMGTPFRYDFALVNECTLLPSGYQIQLKYDGRVLPEPSIRILAAQFRQIIDQLCRAHTNKALSSIRCYSEEDSLQISLWNHSTPKAQKTTAHAIFQRQARVSPKAQAICAWDGDMTFEELEIQSTLLARHFSSIGVRPEVLVPLCFEKSKWMTVSILAVLKAGGAWIPLDPKHPVGRLEQVLRIAKANLVVCSTARTKAMRDLSANVIVPELLMPDLVSSQGNGTLQFSKHDFAASSRTAELHSAKPDSTAYVLFTSGSTGEPKGVVISHGALCTGIVEQAKPLGCGPHWRCLQFSASTFDPSISETLMTLCHGGCVCIPSEHQRLNDLPGAIRELNANCAQLTPSVASVITPEEVPSLKTLIFVGEAASDEIVIRWADRVRLINAYGPTETCIYCSVKDFSPDTSPRAIGAACGGNNWIVEVENHELLAAVGCIGEIVVSGNSLGKGYLENQAATDAAFVTCSWLKAMQTFSQSDRIYRTGDLGFYNTDGSIQLIGRKDNQIKLRGNRIELGEIERRLIRFAPDATILVCVPKEGPCKQQLVALFCYSNVEMPTKGQSSITLASDFTSEKSRSLLEKLHHALARDVPDYMIPSYWVIVNQFPLNNSGKLNRKIIREWVELIDADTYELIIKNQSDAQDGHALSNEHTDLFNEIRDIWSLVLQADAAKITPDTSFFALNGDSLSAIRVVALCKKKGLDFTVQDIFGSRTLARLCQVARRSDDLSSTSTDSWCPLTSFQERHFALYGDSSPSTEGRIYSLLHMLIEKPQKAVKHALDNLVQSYPMLRAQFSKTENGWKQRPKSFENYRLKFAQHRNLNEEEQEAVKTAGYNSIDLLHGPVFSVDIYRTDRGPFIYMVTHRAVIDEGSWQVIYDHLHRFFATSAVLPLPSSKFFAEVQVGSIHAHGLESTPYSLKNHVISYLLPKTLQEIPGGVQNIEDVLPCSPIQRDMLEYQSQDSSLFVLQLEMEVVPRDGVSINLERLLSAWGLVVQRHSILRTVLIDPTGVEGPFQVVLRSIEPRVELVSSWGEAMQPTNNLFGKSGPFHRLTLHLSRSGSVKCLLRISHTLTDGWSNTLIQRDLIRAYTHGAEEHSGVSYQDFVNYNTNNRFEQHLAYWVQKLQDSVPCWVRPSKSLSVEESPSSVAMFNLPAISRSSFSAARETQGLTLATIVDAAWALTLKDVTNQDTVTFGHILSGRSHNIPGIAEIVGPTLGVLVSQAHFDPVDPFESTSDLVTLALKLQAARFEGLSHDGCSALQIQTELGVSPLYNTIVNFQADQQPVQGNLEYDIKISFDVLQDPWNVDIMLRVWGDGEILRSRLEYKNNKYLSGDIRSIAECFGAKLHLFELDVST